MNFTEIFLNRLPNKVFPERFLFEIYNYDEIFFTEDLDGFFDTLEHFVNELTEDRPLQRIWKSLYSLGPIQNGESIVIEEPNG